MWVLHFLGSATIQLPQIKDCGKINESGLFPRSPPMGVFERINGLVHRANLHPASQRNFSLAKYQVFTERMVYQSVQLPVAYGCFM